MHRSMADCSKKACRCAGRSDSLGLFCVGLGAAATTLTTGDDGIATIKPNRATTENAFSMGKL